MSIGCLLKEYIELLVSRIVNMVFYPTIGRQYFVKTQTYVALFGPRDLSQIFSNGMYIEVSPL